MITITECVEPSQLSHQQPAPVIEYYQALVHRLLSSTTSTGAVLKTIGVTSCASGEGASTVAAQLAATAAGIASRPVLLLDMNTTDARHASTLRVWRQLGLQNTPETAQTDAGDGLTVSCHSGVQASRYQNLSLQWGRDADQLQPPIDRGKVSALLADLDQDFGLIVVDLPPATESSLTLAMAGLVSGVLLVIEAEGTHTEAARRARQNLDQAQANMLGVIMNKRTQHIPGWLYSRL